MSLGESIHSIIHETFIKHPVCLREALKGRTSLERRVEFQGEGM